MIPTATKSALQQYTDGDYANRHPDWHVNDAPNKAADMLPGLLAIADDLKTSSIRVADVGAGVGGVVIDLKKRLEAARPGCSMEIVAFEIAPECVSRARELFPNLDMRQKLLEASDGPFDVILFADVLEHVENPWELLRTARAATKYILVRQPLLESFSTFRHNNYRNQFNEWGHIFFFNHRSFLEICRQSGWHPLKIDLVAPWELHPPARPNIIKRSLLRMNRLMCSYFMSGFYLNGAFKGE
jgi:SAM-dependent methyltransferase